MGDPAQDFLESGGETSHPLDASNDASNDPTISKDPSQAFLDSGGSAVHPLEKVEKSKADSPSYWEQYAQDEAEANTGASEAVLHAATGVGSSLLGGFRYAMGADRNLTPEQIERNKQSIVYQPKTEQGKKTAAVVDAAGSYLGQKEGEAAGPWATDAATRMGLPPAVAGGVGATAETLANVPQYLLPAALKGIKGRAPADAAPGSAAPKAAEPASLSAVPADQSPLSATGAARTPYFEINDPQSAKEFGVKPEKVEAQSPANTGNLTPQQEAARKALAARVGLKEVRTSAIEGNAQDAADDFDSTKYTKDPMGERMLGVLKGERQALTQHAAGIIDDLGAKEGTDQSTLIAKGKTMAAPLDALSDHIDAATTDAYEAAKAKGGDEPVQFPKLEAALRDKSLKNSLLAQGKEGFLQGVQSQWDDFKDTNPGGVNASVAEQYRQFLNTLWKTNPEAVGKLKDAMDTDMHAHFGENIFGDARQLHQLGKTLLEQPKGVAQIAGKDPHAPVNRTTDYEDIPDKIANMSGDQFKNLINTYKMMPEELQPQAQSAIKEIQGHMVNRLLDAGSKYETQWNKKGVNTELSNNSENFKTAFADSPEAAAKIKDLKDAGEMLRFNSGYRGAHAQASNMLRKGIGAGAEAAGTGVGAGIGTFVAGPGTGTLAGGMAGKYLAGKGMGALDARAARKAVEARVTQIP
jgi:hypothetical protein